MQVILQADQRPKQNHKDVLLPAHPQELYFLVRELGLILNHKNMRSPTTQCRSNLLRRGSLPRDNDGAIEFWRSNIGTGGMERLCCTFHTAHPRTSVAP